MTSPPVRLLLIEDNRDDAELLQTALAKFAPGDFAITHAERLADALARIRTGQFDIVLSDLGLPDSTRLATVQAIAARAPALPLVVLTGMKDDDLGRAAIQHGAQDYLVKGETSGALTARTLRYAIERKRLEIELRAANEGLAERVAGRSAQLAAANAILFANAAGYRQLFVANPHPMYMYDPETLRFLAVNDAMVAHYGWSLEEFLAMTIADIHPAGTIQRPRCQIKHVSQQRIGQGSFWTHRKKDGTLIDVEVSAHVIEFGGRSAWVVLADDITESRRAQEALRESAARFRSLSEMSSDFYWESDVEHRFTRGNSAADLSVLSVGRMQIGKRPWETPYLSPDEAGWQAHRAVLEAHQPFRKFELSCRGTDGTEHHLSVSGDPVFDASGAFTGYRGVGSDITERKQAAEAKAKLAAIVEHSNDAIIGRVLDGTVTSWNAAAERMLGYTAAETIGRDPVEIISPPLRQQIAENRRLVRAGQIVPNHETVLIAKDGRPIDFVVSLSAIKDERGRVIGTATTLCDITERKRIEQALHDNAKRLQGVSRRLFTVEETERRNINRELHDRIGQSLSGLNISLNIIRSQLPQESLDIVGARLQGTQTLLEGMARQVRDVMADLHPPALDDYGLLAALRTCAETFGARRAVPISVHGEDLAPRPPLAAEMALFRVAQGALANAVAHARATRIQVMLAATPDRVTLTIADDGAGFDVAHAARAHASWGLAIMRERAEAVGARLTVESTPGKGTRVVVEIDREAA